MISAGYQGYPRHLAQTNCSGSNTFVVSGFESVVERCADDETGEEFADTAFDVDGVFKNSEPFGLLRVKNDDDVEGKLEVNVGTVLLNGSASLFSASSASLPLNGSSSSLDL